MKFSTHLEPFPCENFTVALINEASPASGFHLFFYLGPSKVLGGASQMALVIKNPPADAGDKGDAGSMPGSGRSPGGGHGNPLQYSCLEKSMNRGDWQVTSMGNP